MLFTGMNGFNSISLQCTCDRVCDSHIYNLKEKYLTLMIDFSMVKRELMLQQGWFDSRCEQFFIEKKIVV